MTGRFIEPGIVSTNFHLREGDVVADLGAGTGYFVATLSQLVGDEGRVYAVEVQKNLVDKIGDLQRQQHLHNVQPIWGDIEEENGTQIADGEVDTVIVVNTLFQVEDKDKTVTEALRILRSGGKLFVIDWSESYGGLGPAPDAVLSEEETKSLCEGQGAVFERSFMSGDHHYGLAFRKP